MTRLEGWETQRVARWENASTATAYQRILAPMCEEMIMGHVPNLPTAAAIEYVAGDLAVRLEADSGFSFADAAAINAGDGWEFNIPDAADHGGIGAMSTFRPRRWPRRGPPRKGSGRCGHRTSARLLPFASRVSMALTTSTAWVAVVCEIPTGAGGLPWPRLTWQHVVEEIEQFVQIEGFFQGPDALTVKHVFPLAQANDISGADNNRRGGKVRIEAKEFE